MRTRTDVWELTREHGPWPKALRDYRSAVNAMRKLDPPEESGRPVHPLSWRYQAAIHGLARPDGSPDRTDPQWSNCQHGSWFFLPWHRMYLLAFERVVQHFLDDDQWALPYWYAVDPDRPERSVLPPAFLESTGGNDLHTEHRSMRTNRGDPLSDIDELTPTLVTALNATPFFTVDGTDTFGGGHRTDPAYNGGEQGLLEDVPHGSVHALVGNDYDPRHGPGPVRRGWMGSFSTAALDPVFWLHHANVDRLWQMWLDADPTHRNPLTDTAWADTRFSFPNPAGGAPLSWTVGEVVDTVALGYRYDTVSPPTGVLVPLPVGPRRRGEPVDRAQPGPPPQVIGATTRVAMVADAPVEVRLESPAVVRLKRVTRPYRRVLLRLEGITGTVAAPTYAVYLNVPAGDAAADHPRLRAAVISTFGVPEASRTDDVHGGTGLTKVLDVTAVRDVLAAEGRWDPTRLTVSFVPMIPRTGRDLVPEIDDTAAPAVSDLRAARVAVLTA